MQVGQIGSCRRAYGRKIAVLLQGDFLSYCGLFTSDVLTALIALRRVGVQLELCTWQMRESQGAGVAQLTIAVS